MKIGKTSINLNRNSQIQGKTMNNSIKTNSHIQFQWVSFYFNTELKHKSTYRILKLHKTKGKVLEEASDPSENQTTKWGAKDFSPTTEKRPQ